MMRLFLFLLLLFTVSPAFAQNQFDFDAFARIPLQHEGRIKPVDTFARNYLYAFNGHESLGDISAEAWLAETLFDPANALHRPLFRILRPEILNLPSREEKYYSYAELAPALQQKSAMLEKILASDEKDLGTDQRELLRLHESAVIYGELLRSFSFLLPLNISVPDALGKEWKLSPELAFTVQEFRRFSPQLKARVDSILKKKGDDLSTYTQDEKNITQFAFEMRFLEQAGENNILLRIIPGQWDGDKGEWYSPWSLMQSGQGSPGTAQYMQLWKNMAHAYLQQDAQGWNDASHEILDKAGEFTPPFKISLEYLYNTVHPLTLSLFLYLATFLAFVFYAMGTAGPWHGIALTTLSAGIVTHLCAVALRVIILSRPPVGTLYESIIFVALICTFVSLMFEFIKKDGNGLITGALCGMLLLFVGQSFAPDDTMKMLVAVLNTNFWLATHVLCITMGYGWCLIVSLLAQLWLIKTALRKEADMLVAPIKTLAIISLLFTSVGTILGGIWADQSWGRFWGWDPKENGALLIVLWLIWILHAQISGHIRRLAAMCAYAALSMVVAIAWFGVNLLSVGLHSYGFITGVAAGLGSFLAFQCLIIGGLFYKIRNQRETA